jgi:proteasome lid subunit RPN8/RPN11
VTPGPGQLRLTEPQYRTIVGSAYDGYPNEACGLLIGTMAGGEPTGSVSEARTCRNEAESSIVYRIDGRDQLAAMRVAEERGEDVVGCWHSHTHTDAYPSPTDIAQAKWYPDWVYVIVTLRDEAPMVRAYRIVDEQVTEVPVVLDRG